MSCISISVKGNLWWLYETEDYESLETIVYVLSQWNMKSVYVYDNMYYLKSISDIILTKLWESEL